MPARDALHWQMVMRDALQPGGILGAFLDGFERSQRGMDMRDNTPPPIEAVPNPIGLFAPVIPFEEDRLRKYWARAIDMSLPFWVDPKMNILITAAAESLPSDTKVMPHDLPATHGFMVIPNGVAEVDLRGQLMVHNAIAWFQRAGGVDLWFLSYKYDERDMVNTRNRRLFGEESYRQFPELAPATYMRVEYGQTLPWSFGSTKTLPPEVVETMQVVQDPKTGSYAYIWGEGYDMNEWVNSTLEMRPSGPMTWLYAVWRLMQQTITDVREEPVERGLRKMVEKRKMKSQMVTVIHLRKRKKVEGDSEREIEWSHQWLVRGHWRQQPYGKRNNRAAHEDGTHTTVNGVCTDDDCDFRVEAIWIHPYLKGPEGAPLLVRDHVYALDR